MPWRQRVRAAWMVSFLQLLVPQEHHHPLLDQQEARVMSRIRLPSSPFVGGVPAVAVWGASPITSLPVAVAPPLPSPLTQLRNVHLSRLSPFALRLVDVYPFSSLCGKLSMLLKQPYPLCVGSI